MIIRSLQCNHMCNPIGFDFDALRLSWVVDSFRGQCTRRATVEIALDEGFAHIWARSSELTAPNAVVLKPELQANTRYYWRVEAESDRGECAMSDTATFLTGRMGTPWEAAFIQPDFAEHPVFIKKFAVEAAPGQAVMNICALGIYEAYINGQRVGEEYLTPDCNDYEVFLQYQTYDIAPLLIPGENEIKVYAGNGWYKGRFGLEKRESIGGDSFALISEIWMTDADGNALKIFSDTSWECETSPVLGGGLYDGEQWDLTIEPSRSPAIAGAIDTGKLRARISPPVMAAMELTPLWVRPEADGSLLIDMGQNMAGLPVFFNRQPRGTKMSFAFGETLQNDAFYNENYRSALGTFDVVSDGEPQWLRPMFTYFGFRYIRVTGAIVPLTIGDVKGLVLHSAMDRKGYVETPHSKVNRLYENALWSQCGNFIDVPTDCPQRDERLGWTGDAQVFSATATYNMDTYAFYRKYFNDLHIEQDRRNGGVPSYAPAFNEGMTPCCCVWGDAITIMPDTLYRFYGDREILVENYPYMKAWVDYIGTRTAPDSNLWIGDFHYGDWVALDGATDQSVLGGTEEDFIASVYYYHSATLTARAASVLGHDDEQATYEQLAISIKNDILREYFSPTGRLAIDTQTGYLICLRYGIYHDKEKLTRGLRRRFAKDLYILKAGFTGASMACQVLCDHGFADLAYKLLTREDFPGWLNEVNLGATTIWERWNSLLADGSVSGTGMNSLNHYAYGSVVEFLYAHAGGLKPLTPGFQKASVRPYINHRLPGMSVKYDSPFGQYSIDWKINADNQVRMLLAVPMDCQAYLPFDDIRPESLSITDHAGEYSRGDDGLTLSAGQYTLTWTTVLDHAHPFDEHTVIDDLMTHPEAAGFLQANVPDAAWLGEEDRCSSSLYDLTKTMLRTGYTPESVAKIADELRKINVLRG